MRFASASRARRKLLATVQELHLRRASRAARRATIVNLRDPRGREFIADSVVS
jgi:hypothetical protein